MFGLVQEVPQKYAEIDPRYCRPAEVELLIGDASKAKRHLGWEPEVDFPTLISMMVQHDLAWETAKLRRG